MDGEERPTEGATERPAEAPPRGPRRRLVTAAWLCSVVAAALLGAWSYAHASPEGRYGRPESLDDAAVRHALARSPERSGAPGSPSPSSSPAGPPRPHRHSATVRFPHGVATAVAECRADGNVRLLSWSPAEGYAVEEAHRGPAATAVLELEPLADDDAEDEDAAGGDSADDDPDGTAVGVHCEHGEPRATDPAVDDDD